VVLRGGGGCEFVDLPSLSLSLSLCRASFLFAFMHTRPSAEMSIQSGMSFRFFFSPSLLFFLFAGLSLGAGSCKATVRLYSRTPLYVCLQVPAAVLFFIFFFFFFCVHER
jgi:hypothetical protein